MIGRIAYKFIKLMYRACIGYFILIYTFVATKNHVV